MRSRYYRQCRYFESRDVHALTNEVMQALSECGHLDFYGGISEKDAVNCMMAKDSAVFGAFESNQMIGYSLLQFVNKEVTHRYAECFGIPANEEEHIAVLNGIAVRPELWNQHVGTNLLRSVIIWADIIGVKYLVGIVHPKHGASLNLLSKCEDVSYGNVFEHCISRGPIPRQRFCIRL